MRTLLYSRKIADWVLPILFPVLLSLACTNRFFVAVVRPIDTEAVTHGKIKVSIDLSPKSLLKNKLTIINKGDDTITVFPIDIVLRIPRTGFRLPAVTDYWNYVRMRYAEADEKCFYAESPDNCTDAIDKIFKQAFKVKPFVFGDILPGEKRSGYIAFNLPEPLNTTHQAKRIAKKLKSETNLLDGEIEVNTVVISKQREQKFVFPVNVVTSSDKSDVLLGVLRNYR